MISPSLQRSILQGELADLELYKSLRKRAQGSFAKTLDNFIQTETRHVAFWQNQFNLTLNSLSLTGRARNTFITLTVRLFGESAGYLLLEAVETHGIQSYLTLWKNEQDPAIQKGLQTILTEELLHEDEAATGGERKISADLVRNAFLGFNDGSVEILGAVNGLVAALAKPELVAIAATTVSIAGAVSMAAGAFMSTDAEHEIRTTQQSKESFLRQPSKHETPTSPWKAALLVGTSYLIGAAVPVAPFLFGATNGIWSILLSSALILFVSILLAFLSGMSIKRRILMNGAVIAIAVFASYGIGSWLNQL
jgi:Uncharacterized membrane protein